MKFSCKSIVLPASPSGTCRGRRVFLFTLLAALAPLDILPASELPRLSSELNPKTQTYAAQQKIPYLTEAYLSGSPEGLNDGLPVGTLNLPGAEEAFNTLLRDDKAGKYSNLDSILLWHDGRLVFEMYNRRGRVDGPHYAMSITKTLTSITLARAIQMQLLTIADLDRPIISFMPAIDRSKIRPGVETITLRDALYMQSGLRFPDKNFTKSISKDYQHQDYFQLLFENTQLVTPESKKFKYTGTDPSMIMMIVDLLTPGTAQEFIAKEVVGKIGGAYHWGNQTCGLPKCGAGSSFTSRTLLKFGIAVIQGGKYNGKQLLSEDYIKLVMDRKKGEGYFYHFHNRQKRAAGRDVFMVSGVGAGGQYMATFPDLNLVAVATAHNKGQINLPLQAVLEHLLPLFIK